MTSTSIDSEKNNALAITLLLEQSDLELEIMRDATQKVGATKVDFADLYLEKSVSEQWSLDEGRIDSGSYSSNQGMAMRAVRGEATIFSSADLINKNTLKRLSEVACKGQPHLVGETQKIHIDTSKKDMPPRYPAINPLEFPDSKRISLLRAIDDYARKLDPRIINVIAGISMAHKTIMVLRNDGSHHCDIRPMVNINITLIVKDNDKVEYSSSSIGHRGSLEKFTERDIEKQTDEALRKALLKFTAAPSPAGMMPVVLGNGWAGILLHEAVGHGLEGDFNRKKQSAFSGRVGERVAPKGVTIVDDGTIENRRGSLSCDDEGMPSGYNVLIEDGILKGYMQDLVNASLMKVAATGNGRRQSYRHEPMPRMTNTYMLNGNFDPQEIISSVKKGLYCKSFSGGSVDITNGNFNFDVQESYLIEDGKIGQHVKGATIIGNGADSMSKMSMVGNDLELDQGMGTCGKNGQWVPVGVGQPHCKVDEMLVGGTEI